MQEKLLIRSFKTGFTRWLRRLAASLRWGDRYRPELHYMRGPGPKSQGRKAPSGRVRQ
jgi:hypothetical protein